MNKTGSFLDIVYVSVIVLVIVVVAAVFGLVFNQLKANDFFNQTTEGAEIQAHVESYIGFMDFFAVFVWFSILVAIGILSYMLRTSPVFMPIMIFVSVILIVIAVLIANIYNIFRESAEIGVELTANYGLSNFLFGNMPILMFVACLLIIIITYGLGGEREGGL